MLLAASQPKDVINEQMPQSYASNHQQELSHYIDLIERCDSNSEKDKMLQNDQNRTDLLQENNNESFQHNKQAISEKQAGLTNNSSKSSTESDQSIMKKPSTEEAHLAEALLRPHERKQDIQEDTTPIIVQGEHATFRGLVHLTIAMCLLNCFHAFSAERYINRQTPDDEYFNICMLIEFVVSALIVGATMPRFLEWLLLHSKHAFFWLMLPIAPCAVSVIVFSILEQSDQLAMQEGQKHSLALATTTAIVQQVTRIFSNIYVMGYLMDLNKQRRHRDCGALLLVFTVPYATLEAASYAVEVISYQNFNAIKVSNIIFMSLSLLGIVYSASVSRFRLPKTIALTRFRLFEIIHNKTFWPLIVALVAYQLISGMQEYTRFFMTQSVYKDFQNGLGDFIFCCAAVPALIMTCSWTDRSLRTASSGHVLTIAVLFGIIFTQSQLVLFYQQPGIVTNILFLAISALGGLVFGFFQVLSCQIALRRCQGYLDVFVWGYLFYLFASLVNNIAPILAEILFNLVFALLFLAILSYFARENSDARYQKLEIIEQTLYRRRIDKRQFRVRYRFIDKINRGSQGAVFKYFDEYTMREVAVKIFSTNSRETYDFSLRELEILSELGAYQNIVKVHQYILEKEDQHTFQIFLIMDLAQGTLEDNIRQRAPPSEKSKKAMKARIVTSINSSSINNNNNNNDNNNHISSQRAPIYFSNAEMRELMRELIHTLARIKVEKRLQHRDLKPTNILLINGKWCVADFGVSSFSKDFASFQNTNLTNDLSKKKTAQQVPTKSSKQKFQMELGNEQKQPEDLQSQTVIGTPHYMSPQLHQNYDMLVRKDESVPRQPINYFKNDIFSLGLTFLNACLLKRLPNANRDPVVLQKYLSELDSLGIYDSTVCNTLRRMLTWEQSQRPNFEDLLLDSELFKTA